MTREEAIDCINAIHVQMFNSGNSKWTEACDMAIEALKERPQGKWEYLKEHITEMRDADGKLNQKETCQFILELMGVIEREGE